MTADEMGMETHKGGVMRRGRVVVVEGAKFVCMYLYSAEYLCGCEQKRTSFLRLTGLSTTKGKLRVRTVFPYPLLG